MSLNRHAIRFLPLSGLGAALAAVLSGCGGATTGGSAGVATPDSSPVIYGLNAQAAIGGTFNATSGLAYTGSDGQTGVLTGATAYKTDAGPGPLPAYQSNFSTGIPLGFPTGGAFLTGPIGGALPTASAGAVVFRAYISTGTKGGNQVDLNTGSVVLTSSESSTFSQPLTFDGAGIGTGPLGQGQYTTATFALPPALATTGLHNLHTVVSDVAGQKSETDFAFAEVGPTDVALFLQSFDTGKPDPKSKTTPPADIFAPITAGDTVTIDGGQGTGTYPTGYAATTADAQGTVVLFTTPGAHTVVETDSKGKVVQTSTFTLPATAVGTTIYAVPAPAATTTASVSKPHAVKRH